MADSDDEYDRKRRDKFRGERSAGGGGGENYNRSDRRDERRSRGRDDWSERGRGRMDYREYRPVRDRGYSPGRGEGPPMKRMRGHDGSGGYGGGGYGGWPAEHHYPMHGGHGFGGPPPGGMNNQREPPPNASNNDVQTQPQMMTLKQFLATQDDSISDGDAIQKYSDYKLEFKRQQLNEFFVAHKDEEWFKIKYHPEESDKRREEQLGYLKNRVDIFSEQLTSGAVTDVTVDTSQTEPLLRLLDTVVIKLEGGSEDDLKILDEKPVEIVKPIEIKIDEDWDKKPESTDKEEVTEVKDKEDEEANGKDKEVNEKEADDTHKNGEAEVEEPSKVTKKRKRSNSGSSSSSSSSSSSDEEETIVEKVEEPKTPEEEKKEEEVKTVDDDSNKMEDGEEDQESNEKMDTSTEKPKEADDSIEIPDDEEKKENDTEDGEKKSNADENEDEDKTETIDLDKEKDPKEDGPKALHKTSSIFLRNLAPTITKSEVESMCKKYNGFLRVAIADPLVERRWFRRGWVTFRRDVNIKEICWKLNNIRLRDCELGAIVNRDLSRRVRPVNGITTHKTIVRSDIKLCAKIAFNLDEKAGLWKDEVPATTESFGLQSANPVLCNITDYLIEEASAEEDELLGLAVSDTKDAADGEGIERDAQLISVLDKLILYLRIVHSVDFYNHCEYPYEDEMPNRCGIIHARGPPPQKVSNTEIQDYIRNFETKMSSFLSKNTVIEPEELKKLGSKDCESEVEKFVLANTQELSKDKWLCPLSGKKFKGPDFIRKHIFNKHGEKVDEVRNEVDYFNNYLKDPKRPCLPEHPGNNKKPSDMPAQHGGFRPGYPGLPGYAPPYAPYVPPIIAAPRPRGGGYGGRRGPGSEYRPIIHYRDLDAPREPDEFV